MREIVIKSFDRVKDHYEVRLGNGTEHRFKSEKATKKFLADTNRFLTEVLFQSNQILSELYTHSREIWMIQTDLNSLSAKNEIELLEHFLKQSQARADWKSGNFFVFIDLKKFCDHAKTLIKSFKNTKYVTQTDTIRKHRLNNLFDQVQGIHMRLLNYGQVDAFQTFSTTKIEDVADVVDVNFKLKVA